MNTTITIKKARLKDRTLEVGMTETVRLNDDSTTYNEVTKKCDALVHDDMLNAFRKLVPHAAVICDLKEADRVKITDELNGDDITNMSVTGFTVSGTDENEGCVLIARKETGKRVLNLITPFIKYSDTDEYRYGSELSDVINACVHEVHEYLNGKCAVKQLSLFDEAEPAGTFENLPEDGSKTKRGRKKQTTVEDVLSDAEYDCEMAKLEAEVA
jgi:hypothetical protein